MEVVASAHSHPRAIQVQQTVTIDTTDGPLTGVSHFEISAEGGQLIQRTDDATIVLLREPIEADGGSWVVESEVVGTSFAGSVPLDFDCSIASVRSTTVVDKARAVVTVSCIGEAEIAMQSGSDASPETIVMTRDYVEGMGLVRDRWIWNHSDADSEGTSYELKEVDGTKIELSLGDSVPATGVGSPADSTDETVLDAAFAGDERRLKALILAGAHVDVRGFDGITPLMVAADSNRVDLIRELIVAGADIDATAGNGGTALIVAAIRGNVETARLLVESGADLGLRIRDPSYDGVTALEIAQDRGDREMIRALSVSPE